MRHGRRGLLAMAPLGSSQVAHDAPLSVKPPAIARSRPKPTVPVVVAQAGKDDKVVQVRHAIQLCLFGGSLLMACYRLVPHGWPTGGRKSGSYLTWISHVSLLDWDMRASSIP